MVLGSRHYSLESVGGTLMAGVDSGGAHSHTVCPCFYVCECSQTTKFHCLVNKKKVYSLYFSLLDSSAQQ